MLVPIARWVCPSGSAGHASWCPPSTAQQEADRAPDATFLRRLRDKLGKRRHRHNNTSRRPAVPQCVSSKSTRLLHVHMENPTAYATLHFWPPDLAGDACPVASPFALAGPVGVWSDGLRQSLPASWPVLLLVHQRCALPVLAWVLVCWCCLSRS